ncbi:hypothetical protein Btru_021713 [Bulinus truncatus]|nr:hypothetical protein Btru_021713 [Bulinus truncatus]
MVHTSSFCMLRSSPGHKTVCLGLNGGSWGSRDGGGGWSVRESLTTFLYFAWQNCCVKYRLCPMWRLHLCCTPVSALECLSPYLSQTPQESATIPLYFMTSLATLMSLVSVSLSVPQSASKVEQLRQEVEGKGVTITLFIGSLLVLMSAPRHILSVLYWMDSIDILYFQVVSKLTSLLLRFNVLLPFIGLMMRVEFRSGVWALVSFKSLDNTRKKIVGQVR